VAKKKCNLLSFLNVCVVMGSTCQSPSVSCYGVFTLNMLFDAVFAENLNSCSHLSFQVDAFWYG